MGHLLDDRRFPANLAGYQDLLDWSSGFGIISAFGIECTGSYGAGLTRHLLAAGVDVIEVNRGHSLTRSRSRKNDAIDAEEAARKVLSGQCSSPAKDTTGTVEAIRHVYLVRDSAIKSRTAALVQVRDILVTAQGILKDRLDAGASRQICAAGTRPAHLCTHRSDQRDRKAPDQAAARNRANHDGTAPSRACHRCPATDNSRRKHRQIPQRGRVRPPLRRRTSAGFLR
ncbi:IS110 family transposase [Arthrobacter sp. R3-55]|uniref:IS110 family transposase n=1 Tax=Paenarthrobacter sp. CM16 TaxID=2738447 RepID=UPI0020A6B9E5|nr:IS110 family transposase [Paenarthrobacter sp. CM16]